MRLVRIFHLVLPILFSAGSMLGQAVTGTLLGSVNDASGARVPAAKITILEVNTGISRAAEANQSGNFVFPNLPAGTYDVTIEATGFRKGIREKVDVVVNSTVRVDMQLEIGSVAEQVVVTAEVPILQTDRTDTGRKIETKTIVDMPLTMNRNFQGLLNLVPGTTRAFRPHSQFFNSQDSLATQVNGQSRLANNIQFEGVDNNHRTGLLTVLIPPIEALQTVDITTSNYEAELGRAGGAVTNITLRSGTNEFHGSAYWYNRVSTLASRSTFLTRKPRGTYNYAGVTFGGPIVRNRTFFFADYLGVRDRNGFGQLLSMPSLDYRAGNFSASRTAIYDPATGNALGQGRTPFPGNVIPENRVSPIARRLLSQLPNPTRTGQLSNFEAATVLAKNTNSWDAKVDHQISDSDRLSVRYSFQEPEVIQPPVYGIIGGPSGTANDGFAGTGTNTTRSAAANYTRVFSPTLVMELRVGVSRYRNDARNTDYGTNAGNEAGIRNSNLSEFTSGLTTIQIASFSNPVFGYSASLPWVRAETNWNLVNNWTKTISNHTLKFGFDARLNRDSLLQIQTFGPRGRFEFNAGATGVNATPAVPTSEANSFAAFLLDAPNRVGRDVDAIYPDYIQNPLFTYVHDKWQVTQKLTLDMGLRHELYPPARPRFAAGFSNYNPENNTLELAGVGTIPENLGRKTYYTNFAPRLGASYRFTEQTVIRAGFGISYMTYPDNSYAYNFPVRQNNAFEPANSFAIASVTMASGFPFPQVAAIPSNGVLPVTGALNNQSYTVIPKDFREGYVMSYNLAIQRSLPGNFVLDAAYVGNRGIRNPTVYNMNAGMIPGAGALGRPLNAKFGRTADTDIRFVGTNTYYNSLQVKLDRRFSNGFQLTTAYTYAKSIDYTSGNGGLRFYINQDRNKARSDFDREHSFVQSYIYELPFGKGKALLNSGLGAWVLGGWQVNGIVTAMGGLPLNFSDTGTALNTPGTTQTPHLVNEFRKLGGIGAASHWFDTSSFAFETRPGTPGSIGRNILSGPGFFNLDFSVFRRFSITERVNTEFRYESFNFTNTPQYGNPNTDRSSGNFGRITGLLGDSVGQPRTMQLGLRVIF